NHENPFDGDEVTHVGGDRTDPEDLERAAEAAQPDVVVDCVAYHPDEVRHAVDMFVDCDAYVVISSGSAYGAAEIPKREGETALCECTAEQERDDSMATYGPRKAEIDRVIADAGKEGANAMSVR